MKTLRDVASKSGKKVNPVTLMKAAVLMCSFIQEKYPEEYEKYLSEVDAWAKSNKLEVN